MAKQTLYMCDLCLTDKLTESEITKIKFANVKIGSDEFNKTEGEICMNCACNLTDMLDKIRVVVEAAPSGYEQVI